MVIFFFVSTQLQHLVSSLRASAIMCGIFSLIFQQLTYYLKMLIKNIFHFFLYNFFYFMTMMISIITMNLKCFERFKNTKKKTVPALLTISLIHRCKVLMIVFNQWMKNRWGIPIISHFDGVVYKSYKSCKCSYFYITQVP